MVDDELSFLMWKSECSCGDQTYAVLTIKVKFCCSDGVEKATKCVRNDWDWLAELMSY